MPWVLDLGMNRIHKLILGESLYEELEQVSVLIVGVGGIGCELLKILPKFNFRSIHIIDLDTIEVSNLNRQFLFRKVHRGLYKANVAKETILSQYPHLKIFSHTANIKDP